MAKKKHHQGHYCKICGQYKANEKFSGKGHAAHICKACSSLSAAEKSEAMTINRLMNLPGRRLSDAEKKWLNNRVHDKRPEVAAMAKEVHRIYFPYAERNAMKKQLLINKLTFEIHMEIYDEYGDSKMVHQCFSIDRKARTLTMQDFDIDESEQSITLDGGRMAKLTRWIVHSLEIFMWSEDYNLSPAGNDTYIDLLPEYRPDFGLSEDFKDKADFDIDDFIAQNTLPEEPESETTPFWRIKVKYSNQAAQDIPCYNESFPDRVEELYFELVDFFELETEETYDLGE